MKDTLWTVTANIPAWKGYNIIVLGQGTGVSDAIADASKQIGLVRRKTGPLSVTVRRPDGSKISVHPKLLNDCTSPLEIEAAVGKAPKTDEEEKLKQRRLRDRAHKSSDKADEEDKETEE